MSIGINQSGCVLATTIMVAIILVLVIIITSTSRQTALSLAKSGAISQPMVAELGDNPAYRYYTYQGFFGKLIIRVQIMDSPTAYAAAKAYGDKIGHTDITEVNGINMFRNTRGIHMNVNSDYYDLVEPGNNTLFVISPKNDPDFKFQTIFPIDPTHQNWMSINSNDKITILQDGSLFP